MTSSEFAVIAVVVVAGSLGIAMLAQHHGDAPQQETARQVQGMYQLGRVVFSITGIVALLAGLIFDIPVVVLGGTASLLGGPRAALGSPDDKALRAKGVIASLYPHLGRDPERRSRTAQFTGASNRSDDDQMVSEGPAGRALIAFAELGR
jgi:hypothetical protein